MIETSNELVFARLARLHARALRLVLFYFREASGREMSAVRVLLGTLENLG